MAEVWGHRSKWVDYSGSINGEKLGVAIFDSPTNPRFPTYWHSRDYGLFALNPFGQKAFDKNEPESRKICNQAEVCRVHHSDIGWIRRVRAAVAHKEQAISLVIDHVVGIVGEFDSSGQSEWLSVVDSEFTQCAIRDIETAGCCNPRQAVWLAETGNALLHMLCLEIDYFHGVIARRGDEKAVARGVDGQVVEFSGDTR